jgi:hypothetical protein
MIAPARKATAAIIQSRGCMRFTKSILGSFDQPAIHLYYSDNTA